MGTPAAIVGAHQEIYGYWTGLRRAGALPARRDIDPAALRRHLPTISLIDVRPVGGAFRIRLAGTGFFDLFGREITGALIEDVFPADEAKAWSERLERVARAGKPLFGATPVAFRPGLRLVTYWLRLPLASDGRRVDMILGYDAISGMGDGVPSGVRPAPAVSAA